MHSKAPKTSKGRAPHGDARQKYMLLQKVISMHMPSFLFLMHISFIMLNIINLPLNLYLEHGNTHKRDTL